ncbi:MAG: sulfotransferase domain-containing protein [Pseudomonadota bacterium]
MKLPYRARRFLRRNAALLPKPQYFLVSYPKSGRTWLRMMIGSAAIDHLRLPPQDPTDFDKLARVSPNFPTTQVTHDTDSTNISLSRIRFRPALYRSSRVIFLARDPRDVLASSFYDQKYRRVYEYDMPEFETADAMVDAPTGGLRGLLRFYNVWAENLPTVRGYLLVSYEDLKADPARELRRCLEFLGLTNVTEVSIRTAVERGAIDKMREAERKGEFHARWGPPDPNNINTYKVRRGVVGGYVDDFSSQAIARMDAIIDSELSDIFARYKYRTEERR